MKKIKRKVRGFILETRDSRGEAVTFQFESDHYAEQVLRGLIHSGYKVMIEERIIEIEYVVADDDENMKKEHELRSATECMASMPMPTSGRNY